MKNKIIAITALLLILVLSGCGTKMAYHNDAYKIKKGNSVYLVTATLRNDYKKSHQPILSVVKIEKKIAKHLNTPNNFSLDEKAVLGDGRYLLRMELEKGDYVFRFLSNKHSAFLIKATSVVPIHEDIKVDEPGVFYLGNINAVIRERKGDEFKAGSSFPLIDQAVVGASGGTFDVKITDKWATDEALFRNKFPALKNTDIKKQILPPFNRERAQKWWKDH